MIQRVRQARRSQLAEAPYHCDLMERIPEAIAEIYRTESRRIFATLVRMLGDFDLAEEALHDAFRAALEQWPAEGVPGNPRAWLVSAGGFKAIDRIRPHRRCAPPGHEPP